ncbi:DNA binding domain-containing protein, excisionase family [Phyllobacterium sp. CL33Tsu]|uniref:helix-turn-helix domain-containing protein n=1 Tax=Phyllobacterium sp. CL33Tsu TaxID=1798191 RepID=UPI0008EDA3DD|nr:helix-turn-helix domain-containing protein [Phyllobacterium sp. CL33Tsu]SFJ31858.1 DNA binding domain-containing protein, excisionase family [Phyllobacterium sp. CL33Tsu]
MEHASHADRKRGARRRGPGHTIKSAAQELDVSPRKVREWIADGTIEPVEFGKLIRIPTAQIEKVRGIFA